MNEGRVRVGWRTVVGFVLFTLSILWPVVIPVLPFLGASTAMTAAISGFMLLAAEVMMISAAAIAGKEGFAVIKGTLSGFLKTYGPPREVNRIRYTIGLIMFAAPLVFAWAAPYFGHHLPGYEDGQLIYAIVGDILLLSSLFVLGGGFWDKLHALVKHDAYAVIPDELTAVEKPEGA